MERTIKFIATNHMKKECIKLIRKENPWLSDDLLQWDTIIQKVTIKLCNSMYFKNNKRNLYIIITKPLGSQNENLSSFKAVLNIIGIKPNLIAKIYTDNSNIVVTSFFSSIGHELGHKYDYNFAYILQILEAFKLLTPKLKIIEKIISYPNEVLADYYSLSKWLNGDINLFIECINYKIKSDKTTESNTHPSWNNRIKYLQVGKFDKDLIRTILKDTGCEDDIVIDKYTDKLYVHYCQRSSNNNITEDVPVR